MAQNFSCPSCGAPLDYDGGGDPTIQCPYCYTSVIVPQELRGQRAERVSTDLTMSLQGQAAKLRELANLVRAGQRDKAAQLYQQIYRVTPQEAQRIVTQLSGGGAVVISASSSVGGVNVSTPSGYTPASTPGSPIVTNPVNYTSTPPMQVYTTTASQPRGGKVLMWLIGGFVVFMFCSTLLSIIVPFVIAFFGAIISVFFQ
ncbi:MAG TPA: hypothetical protein VJ020_09275 [Anaerolineales bacterium]|nr:hypothetical protein [Anaerolineales bacterium]